VKFKKLRIRFGYRYTGSLIGVLMVISSIQLEERAEEIKRLTSSIERNYVQIGNLETDKKSLQAKSAALEVRIQITITKDYMNIDVLENRKPWR